MKYLMRVRERDDKEYLMFVELGEVFGKEFKEYIDLNPELTFSIKLEDINDEKK